MTSNNSTNDLKTTTTTTKITPATYSSPSPSDILASFAPSFISTRSNSISSIPTLPTTTQLSSSPSNIDLNNKTTTTTSTLLSSSPLSTNSALPRSQTDPDIKGLGLGLAGLRKISSRNFTTGGSAGGSKDDRSTIGSGSLNDSSRRTGRKATGVSIPGLAKDVASEEEEEPVEDGVGKGKLVLEKYVLYETKLVS